MCGIAGAFFFDSSIEKVNVDTAVKKMSDRMQNRGPDSYGYWCDTKVPLGLGHRRLSILDLDSRSDQPMISEDERYVIVFNGEIYNFREIKADLISKGESFKTTGDTEVVLKLFAREKENMLQRLRGMFAIVIWDRFEKVLFAARDPYGIKPLYYSLDKDRFLFASQVKALLESGLVSRDPSPLGQAGFWLMGSVPEPYTWFKNIQTLPAGTWCLVSSRGEVQKQMYWNIAEVWRNAPECHLNESQVQSIVRDSVLESVKKHLISDVPVGVFLSGGIDSGSVAGLIQDVGVQKMKGITITFQEFENKHEDEAPIAAQVAKTYGFDHYIRKVSREEFEADLHRIIDAMDQPSLDGINTWYATKAVREQNIKVVLSGVGGDELFYGYPSFSQLPKLVKNMNLINCIPEFFLSLQASRTRNQRWNYLAKESKNLYGAYWLRRGLYAPSQLPELMGNELAEQALHNFNIDNFIKDQVGELASDPQAAVGQMESMLYLRNQLLRDSDWASMDHSVELRTPLVDAWLLKDLSPVLRSFHKYRGKCLLANSPVQHLNRAIVDRRKTGFGIPLGQWLSSAIEKNKINVTQSGDESRKWAKILTHAIYQ